MYEQSEDAHALMPHKDASGKPVPYVYHEYPRTLYRKDGETKIVNSAEELKAAGQDWSTEAVLPPPEPPVISEAHKIAVATHAEIKNQNFARKK